MKPKRLEFFARDIAPFALLLALIAASFLLGGSSREDAVGVFLLRPFAILCLFAGSVLLVRNGAWEARALVVPAVVIAGFIALQLIPLPPFIWQALPGRELMTQAATYAGGANSWQPFAMVPWRGANAFFALSVPIATLVLVSVVLPGQRIAMMTVFVAFSVLSALLGVLQTLAPASSALRVDVLTSGGVPTGLLANRNHQAALLACAIPAIAAIVARHGLRGRNATGWRIAAITAVVLVVPMTFLTGSRAGLLLLAIALFSTLTILPREWLASLRFDRERSWLFLLAAAAVALLVLSAAVYVVYRTNSAERLSATNIGDDLRFQYWLPILAMIWKYFPFGSGVGSFVEVFQIDEPSALLGPNYVNHAHSDWIELVLEGGIIAGAVLAIAVFKFFVRLRSVLSSPRAESVSARAAVAIIFILAIGSLVDYPLRTPALAVIFALACAWSLTRDDVPRRIR